MCEAIIELFQEEYDAGINDALKRGKLTNLAQLVQEGLLSMDDALRHSEVSEEEFRKYLA